MKSERTLVMGILNVTPDSFADGGRHFDFEAAINRAKEMISEGVDIIDVGGESTRPGADRVTEEIERDRVIPVITELSELGVTLSIDTTRASIAQAAIGAGATIVNDVSGGLADPKMAALIASNPAIQYVVMHWRGHSKDMQKAAEYQNVVSEVKDELDDRVVALTKSGVLPEQIVLDPGIGFAKSSAHNWELLKNIDRLNLLGFPILVGASRKRFLGDLLSAEVADDRESASIAITTYLAKAGIWGVRTHSVKPHRDAIAVVEEMRK
ncbi:MAG: dihydropteroate synthase [Actinobacteria bacterium]|nr:dihydropteroate synthase [Actinomycetota bacterium]MDA2995899.1 dihydropteroate synthase [Actinomycetota bacterium]